MNLRKLKQKAIDSKESIRTIYYKINERTGGIIGIIRHATNQFALANGSETAASVSYYTLFSIFPLLIFLVSIAGFFLKKDLAQRRVLEAVQSVLPVGEQIITENIQMVLQLRGSVGIIALLSLIWSASTVFNNVIMYINRAFPGGRKPNFIHSHLMALIITLALALLFVLSIISTPITDIIPSFTIAFQGKYLHETFLWQILSLIVPFLIKFFLFWALYQWIPRTSVKRKAAFLSALVIAISWEIVTNGFTWFVGSSFANYRLVYGSLGSIIALLFWIYLTGILIIYGAHLTHAIDFHIRASEKKRAETNDQPAD